jgi:pyruvate/2-oxoglutarate dehydrogenase complex dihydrolipoamide acyltransferase (E2) component
MADIEHPATDPKALKRQERQKFYDDLNKQKQEKKRVKLAERKKIREEYLKQNAEINKYEKLCKDDIKNRLIDLRKQVTENKLNKKDAKIQFKTFRKERIKQFRQDEQRVLNLSSEELRQSFSFRFKR